MAVSAIRVLVLVAAAMLVGCPMAHSPIELTDAQVTNAGRNSERAELSGRSLIERIDRTLEFNRTDRRLSVDRNGAWQILHGILAYGDRFEIDADGRRQVALDYLMSGHSIDGFQPRKGDWMGTPPRPGLRIEMDVATKVGQGHRDQWLAIVSQTGLPIDSEIAGDRRTFTLEDWLRQAEFDLPRNLELEFSWTLIPLVTYRGTEHRWTARDGYDYSVAQLVASEIEQSLESSVCGGTHRLIGVSMALDKRRREGLPLSGVWKDADEFVQSSITAAREHQNADGSFSITYLHRPGWTRDLGETLGTTGHVLEFLAFAADDETINQRWVRRAASRLCDVLDLCADVDLECGVLYHALHGLSHYKTRLESIPSSP